MCNNCHYKFFWRADHSGHGGVGILIKEKWPESGLSTFRVNYQIMMLKMLIEKTLVNVTCVYALQVSSSNHNKDVSYEQLLTCISSVDGSEIHIFVGDFNGYVGEESITFDSDHVSRG